MTVPSIPAAMKITAGPDSTLVTTSASAARLATSLDIAR